MCTPNEVQAPITTTPRAFCNRAVTSRGAAFRRLLTALVAVVSMVPGGSVQAAQPSGKKLGVALYGGNGHQVSVGKLTTHPRAKLVAISQGKSGTIPAGVKVYATLEELLKDPQVELVSLCSPRRADQA